ncbi:MAG TPA: hypothetical protein PKD18_08520 [Saprospiraceae bacterium]|nr:hypothetical protein [Saprospiraceae bacterium]
MRIVRLILILLVGGFLTYFTYKKIYQTFFFEAIIWLGFIILGSLIFVWTVYKDIQLFKTERRLLNYGLTFLSMLFIVIIVKLEIQIINNFNKPTLLEVSYNGDFNGTGIDFKTDGTYIFENSAIGISDYFHGTYRIEGNKITMDKDTIDNLTDFKFLEIKVKELDQEKTDLYMYQVDGLGNVIAPSYAFRVTIDNRKK